MSVVKGIDMRVEAGEVVSLVGANGAGKTTTLKAISAIVPAKSGRVEYMGDDITHLAPYKIVELGLIQIPEGRKIFPQMSVKENLVLGSYTAKAKIRRWESLDRIYSLFPILKQRSDQFAGTLSGGEQQMLAIGRGLMSLPKLLMLDEPSLGLSPVVVEEIFESIKGISSNGTTILLVEQNIHQSLEISTRGYVMENGSIAMEGQGKELLENEHIKRAYLGL